jgi:hypothetical protein
MPGPSLFAQTAATGAASARAGAPAIGENCEAITRQSAIPPLRTLEPMPLD